MHLFEVTKGTKSVLFKRDGDHIRNHGDYTTKKDLVFNEGDIVIDANTYHNTRHTKSATAEMIKLAKNDLYVIFAEPGTLGINSKYFLAVLEKDIKFLEETND